MMLWTDYLAKCGPQCMVIAISAWQVSCKVGKPGFTFTMWQKNEQKLKNKMTYTSELVGDILPKLVPLIDKPIILYPSNNMLPSY